MCHNEGMGNSYYGYGTRNSRYAQRSYSRKSFTGPKEMVSRYESKCSKCGGKVQVGQVILYDGNTRTAAHKLPEDCAAAVEAKQAAMAAEKPAVELELSELPSGHYWIEGVQVKVDNLLLDGHEGDRWYGWIFVRTGDFEHDSKGERAGSQRPGSGHYTVRQGQVDVSEQLERILQNPLEAAAAFGLNTGRCGKCFSRLTDPDSIATGIGPVCAKHYGVERVHVHRKQAVKAVAEKQQAAQQTLLGVG